MDHIFLVEEFGGFTAKYEISHNQIIESILNHIRKYVVFNKMQRQNNSDIDSTDEDNSGTDSTDENNSDTDSTDEDNSGTDR